jgi:iron-sulfur cluster assembly protein
MKLEKIGVSFTDAAIAHVIKSMEKRGGAKGLRLGVKKTGCSGYSYVVDYVDTLQESDTAFTVASNLTVFIDKSSLPFLQGVKVDYLREGLNGMFKFSNPNEKGSCGCGESFTI